jgi:hypothetical protein
MNALPKKLTVAAFAVVLAILLLTVYFVENSFYSNADITSHSSAINGLQLTVTLDAKTTIYKQGQVIKM